MAASEGSFFPAKSNPKEAGMVVIGKITQVNQSVQILRLDIADVSTGITVSQSSYCCTM